MNKRIKTVVISLLLTFGLSNLYAGAGHSHEVSQKKIEINAQKALDNYLINSKIDKSWSNAKLISSKKNGKEWIVTFKNKKIKNNSKQELNFYLTSYGKIKGANYKK
ncbi:hypothetical protein CRV02_01340 [Arcobacter sp. CECT 8989]|uniref:DUF6488 family protein n=1 Tax=Arcobacter sp. CECT 8989 TaxID=2044509 RepID=UPI00100BD6A9|nr:DUF6488 family protein [Arcobacter sp. CECT 8989]RXK03864.1 hypothetical protein CRV02_01340 [Arcobacter sp. CECT 8989]